MTEPDEASQARLPRALPESVALSASAMLDLLDAFADQGLELHSVMVARRGCVVAEGWWAPYAPDRVHMLHSATKAFTATGVALAVQEGLFTLDDRVLSFFPERRVPRVSDHLGTMRVRDLLTQTSGHGHGMSGSVWRGIATSWVDEFLKIEVPHAPGTHFQYSSATSFMLSAIITRRSGLSLHDYLRPRLFEPLDIRSVRWDVGPEGINPGGNGISASTEDLLRLAMLHAADGRWGDRQILPAGWVAAASQAAHGRPYGYHWWVWPGTPGLFAFGAFGQYAFVLPEHDFALVTTAAVPGSISRPDVGIPPLVWARLPRMLAGADGDPSNSARLAERLRGLKLRLAPEPAGADASADVGGARYRALENPQRVQAIGVDFVDEECVLHVEIGGRDHAVRAGMGGRLVESATTLPGADLHHGYAPSELMTVAAAAWTGPRTLTIQCQYVETAFRDTFVLEFSQQALTFRRSVNVNGGATSHPPLDAMRTEG